MASLLQLPLLREVLHLATQLLALPRLGVPGARAGVQELADGGDQPRGDPEGQHRVVLGLGDEVVDELLHDVLLEFGWGFGTAGQSLYCGPYSPSRRHTTR